MNDYDFSPQSISNPEYIKIIKNHQSAGSATDYCLGRFIDRMSEEKERRNYGYCLTLFANGYYDFFSASETVIDTIFSNFRNSDPEIQKRAYNLIPYLVDDDFDIILKRLRKRNYLYKYILNFEQPGALDLVLELLKSEDRCNHNITLVLEEKNYVTNLFEALLDEERLDIVSNIKHFIHSIAYYKTSHHTNGLLKFFTLLNENCYLQEFVEKAFNTKNTEYQTDALLIVANLVLSSSTSTFKDGNTNLPKIYTYVLPHLKDMYKSFETLRPGTILCHLVYILVGLVYSGIRFVHSALGKSNIFEPIIKLFYSDYQCTTIRHSIQSIIGTTYRYAYLPLQKSVLKDGEYLNLLIEMDKQAVAIKKEKNLAPDYWLISAEIMKLFYIYWEEKNPKCPMLLEAINKNPEFIKYCEEVILPRDLEPTEFFTKKRKTLFNTFKRELVHENTFSLPYNMFNIEYEYGIKEPPPKTIDEYIAELLAKSD